MRTDLTAICLLTPAVVSDYLQIVRLAADDVPAYLEEDARPPQQQAALSLGLLSAGNRPDECWSLGTLGAAQYRAGQHAAAEWTLRYCLQRHAQGGDSWAQFFLAMVCHQLKKPDEAKQWLAKAIAQVERHRGALDWQSNVRCGQLRQEAEETLSRPPVASEKIPGVVQPSPATPPDKPAD